ncbi:hypothetical protein BSKO_04896 [Bryopsis sp. KO-2023]|nr:hypothetical protein BSKO_04896 [Bryopsis sp. KO-2023]
MKMSVNATTQREARIQNVAVIGAGLGGLAVTYHLLAMGRRMGEPTSVNLYDAHGIGAGASGAAAGILHPCSPKGKVTWNGVPAMAAALKLIHAAELAAQRKGCELPICWRNGVIRVAKDSKQVENYRELGLSSSAVECLSLAEASDLVPGLIPPELDGVDGAALWIKEGAVIHPQRYMQYLWHACEDLVESDPNGKLNFRTEAIESLEDVKGQYDAIVVAAGAATGAIKELADEISMRLCQGYTLEMADKQQVPSSQEITPSLLGEPYIGFQGSGSLVLGATREYDWTPENSFLEAGGRAVSESDCPGAVSSLKESGAGIWGPLENWEVVRIRSGVRALTSMTNTGAMPYAGKVHLESVQPECWLATGLGARGVLYHAWLGELLAKAIIDGDEGILPPELRRWKKN